MSVADSRMARGAATALWRRMPGAVARFSGTLRALLRDGDYLLSWPAVAAVAPPLALLLGLLFGAVHGGPVFAASLTAVLVLAALAGLGAGLGLAALVGYAVGDLALQPHAGAGYLAALDSYLVLAGLLVAAPLVVTALRQHTQRLMRPGAARLVVGFAVAATVQGWLAYFWALAAAELVRPAWSFTGATPDPAVTDALRGAGGWTALVTVLTVAGRGVLTALAARYPGTPPRAAQVRFRLARPLPWPVPVLLGAATLTLLLAGVADSAVAAVGVFALFVGVGVVRYRVIPALGPYARAVERVPVVLRVAACCLVGYLMGLAVTRPLAALLPPLILAALLLPRSAP